VAIRGIYSHQTNPYQIKLVLQPPFCQLNPHEIRITSPILVVVSKLYHCSPYCCYPHISLLHLYINIYIIKYYIPILYHHSSWEIYIYIYLSMKSYDLLNHIYIYIYIRWYSHVVSPLNHNDILLPSVYLSMPWNFRCSLDQYWAFWRRWHGRWRAVIFCWSEFNGRTWNFKGIPWKFYGKVGVSNNYVGLLCFIYGEHMGIGLLVVYEWAWSTRVQPSKILRCTVIDKLELVCYVVDCGKKHVARIWFDSCPASLS